MYDEKVYEYLRDTVWDASRLGGNEVAWEVAGLVKCYEMKTYSIYIFLILIFLILT